MSKFYKTTIMVEVLSEEPVDFDNLAAVDLAITDGDCSGKWEVSKVEELDKHEAATALMAHGSDPSFFQIDTEDADEPACTCGSRLFNEKGDCQKCGL